MKIKKSQKITGVQDNLDLAQKTTRVTTRDNTTQQSTTRGNTTQHKCNTTQHKYNMKTKRHNTSATRVQYETTRVQHDTTEVQRKLWQQKQGSTLHFLSPNYIFS